MFNKMNLINKFTQWSNFRLFYLIYYLVIFLLVLDVLEPYIYYLYIKLFYVYGLDNPLKIVYHYIDMSRYAFLDLQQFYYREEDPVYSESYFPSKKCFRSFYFGNAPFYFKSIILFTWICSYTFSYASAYFSPSTGSNLVLY